MRYKVHKISYEGRRTYGYESGSTVIIGGTSVYQGGGSSSSSEQETTPTPTPSSQSVTNNLMTAYATLESDTPGHWNANIPEISYLYDGLVLPIRISTNCYRNNEGYNTLNINNSGAKLVWFDYNKPAGQQIGKNDELVLVYREDAGRFTIPTGGTGELVSDVVPSDGTVSSGWIIMSSDDITGSGGIDLSNYYTKNETDAIITNVIEQSISSGQVLTLIENYLVDNNYVKYVTMRYADYLAMPSHDSRTLYITTYGNYLGDIDMCCGSESGTTYYEVEPERIYVESGGGTYTVSVTANTDYNLILSDNWFSSDSLTGDVGVTQFTITVNPLPDTNDRAGTITVGDKTVTIIQYANEGRVYYPLENYSFDESGGTLTDKISGSGTFRVYTTEDWIHTNISGGTAGDTLEVSVDPYNGSRAGYVIVGGVKRYVVQTSSNTATVSDYLTFDVISGGTIKYENWHDLGDDAFPISYSKNNGPWVSVNPQAGETVEIPVSKGDSVRFKGTNTGYTADSGDYGHFTSSVSNSAGYDETDALYVVRGNIMSMVYGDNFATHSEAHRFGGLFQESAIVRADNLILPTTDLTGGGSYAQMFNWCDLLMYPPVLPATTLTYGCYSDMFAHCSNLRTAPALPATTLKGECYYEMFYLCHRLETAPVLPASTLPDRCYYGMFKNCSSLNYVKCLATSFGQSSTSGWLNYASSTGTFVKHPNATWSTGGSGIPSGWTVQDATS